MISALPNVTSIAASTPAARDRVIDAVRGLSLVVVVFGHLFLAVVYWPPDESPRIGSLMLAYPWTQVLTWVLQVMPLFFAFGGAANARGWTRARDRGTNYSSWVWGRARRLLRPVVIYLAVCAGAAWLSSALWGAEAAPLLGQLGVHLWFLGVYLVTTALLPPMLTWHRRNPAGPFVILAPVVGIVSVGTTILGWPPFIGFVNLMLVWLLLQQLGFFWAANPSQASPRRWAGIGAGCLGLAIIMVKVGPWPVSLVGIPGYRLNYDTVSIFGTVVAVPGYQGEYSNMVPPSIVLLLQGVAIVSAVFVCRRPLSSLLHRTRIWWATTAINVTALTTYLWHVPAIMLAFVVLHAAGRNPPTEIGSHGYPVPVDPSVYFLWFPLLLVTFLAILAVFVTALWSTEYRPLPWWDRPAPAGGCTANSALSISMTALGAVTLWVSFMILAIIGLRGFPDEIRYWFGIPLNSLWAIAGFGCGSYLLRTAAFLGSVSSTCQRRPPHEP